MGIGSDKSDHNRGYGSFRFGIDQKQKIIAQLHTYCRILIEDDHLLARFVHMVRNADNYEEIGDEEDCEVNTNEQVTKMFRTVFLDLVIRELTIT